MTLGDLASGKLRSLFLLLAAGLLVALPHGAMAQDGAGAAAIEAVEVTVDDPGAVAVDGEEAAPEAPAFDHFGPDMIKGQPTDGAYGFQEQYTPNGDYALWMHDAILMPIIVVISLFVLILLGIVVAKYNKRSNPVPSKTSHNTLIEVIWTVVPVIILLVIAVPSITLLARQYESPPEDALTIKANGYQWYWGYEYVDNGGFELISNMLDEEAALAAGEPHQLAVDNRMVVPVGETIRIQTFGADVIHSFGIPSLWFKIDAVPGRINEGTLLIEEPGIYYGQCMELCGARHGFMPIAIEARSRPDFERWLASAGGKTRTQLAAEAAAEAEAAAAQSATEEAAADEAGEAPAEDAGADAETTA